MLLQAVASLHSEARKQVLLQAVALLLQALAPVPADPLPSQVVA
jgi:hypothetical protein